MLETLVKFAARRPDWRPVPMTKCYRISKEISEEYVVVQAFELEANINDPEGLQTRWVPISDEEMWHRGVWEDHLDNMPVEGRKPIQARASSRSCSRCGWSGVPPIATPNNCVRCGSPLEHE